jgi:acyl-CoA dehydrogenase
MDFELSEEQKMIQGLARDFVQEQLMPLERDILGRAADLSDARAWLPEEKEAGLARMVREMGLWGIGVPEELGGAGLDTLGVCLVEEELARTVVPFHFGDVTPILFDGTPGQRERFLRPALDGEKRPYLALLEPGGGADPAAMKTRADRADGQYVLNGTKLSLSRPGRDYFGVAFAVTDAGPTCFLVEKDTPGFTVAGGSAGEGWRAPFREPMALAFAHCRVPPENVLGKEGRAFHLGREWLPRRRIVRSARSVGIARRLLEEAAVQAQALETFGQPVHRRANIMAALADMAASIHAARLTVHEAAWMADAGRPVRHEAAMVKLQATRMVHAVADRVAHVFNAPPFVEGAPSMERLCRRAIQAAAAEFALERQWNIVAADVLKGMKV